jgi:hypothetical protein
MLKEAAESTDAGLAQAVGIVKLDVYNNPNVTTVAPFAVTLRELNAQGNSGITDAGLAQAAGIVRIYVDNNPKVTTVAPFAVTLRELNATGSSGITDAGLAQLQALSNSMSATIRM